LSLEPLTFKHMAPIPLSSLYHDTTRYQAHAFWLCRACQTALLDTLVIHSLIHLLCKNS